MGSCCKLSMSIWDMADCLVQRGHVPMDLVEYERSRAFTNI